MIKKEKIVLNSEFKSRNFASPAKTSAEVSAGKQNFGSTHGFTLIEILITMGIIAVLAGIVLIAINPARQFKQAHDTTRESNINAILNAVGENIADNKGVFTCVSGALPTTTPAIMKMPTTTNAYDIYPCIIPTYIADLPYDPTIGSFASSTSYNTNYTIFNSTTTGRITVTATGEITPVISVTR